MSPRGSDGTANSAPDVAPAPLPQPLTLKMISEKGRKELTINCSKSISETYLQNEIREKKIEAMDFKVLADTTDVGATGNIKQTVVTTEKEGDGLLHDYAYPEPGEILQMEYAPNGNVLYAGHFSKDSVFYLPAVPLPDKPVQVGDTWSNTNSWKSEVGGMPLTVMMESKYVGPKICGKFMCAEVQVKGTVHMLEKLEKETGFTHTITGRYLYEPRQGLLAWSEFLSDEQLQGKGARVVLRSTLRSELVEPRGYRTADRGEPSCPFETKGE